jgi:hypothetical protein
MNIEELAEEVKIDIDNLNNTSDIERLTWLSQEILLEEPWVIQNCKIWRIENNSLLHENKKLKKLIKYYKEKFYKDDFPHLHLNRLFQNKFWSKFLEINKNDCIFLSDGHAITNIDFQPEEYFYKLYSENMEHLVIFTKTKWTGFSNGNFRPCSTEAMQINDWSLLESKTVDEIRKWKIKKILQS